MNLRQRIAAALTIVVAIAAIVVVSTTGDTPGDGPETTGITGATLTGQTATTSPRPESTGTSGERDDGNEGSSPGATGSPSDGGSGPSKTDPTGPEDGGGASTTTKPPPPLTLEEFFGTPSGPDVLERSRLQAVERSTARCMDQRGFSYRPREILIQPEAGPGLDVVRRIGFGISTSWSSGGGAPRAGSTVPPITAPRRPQYYVALEGGYLGDGHEADDLGCRSYAAAIQNDRFRPAQEAWSALEPELAEVETAIGEDERVSTAVEEWSGCMAEAGFAYDQPSQVFTEGVAEIQTRVDELTGGRTVNTNPFAGWSDEEIETFYRENSEEAVQRYIDEVTSITVPEVDGEKLREIQDFEISLATANARCGRIMDHAEDSIRPEYEGAFIAEHRQALDAIRSQVADLLGE